MMQDEVRQPAAPEIHSASTGSGGSIIDILEVAEYSFDRETANAELSAVLEYYSKIKERCIAKPETYAERKRRREAEISGLKEALSILEDETAFVQRKSHGVFRGTLSSN